MPQVQVSPDTSLYYEIKPCSGTDVKTEDMPWLLILHPQYQDMSCIKQLIEDPILRENFNMILFDGRYHGRSSGTPSAFFDLYTHAADLAIGMNALKIPSAHCISSHPWATEILLRMGYVFKEKVLSLCLCHVPPEEDDEFFKNAFQECFNCWSDPQTPEDYDEAVSSNLWWNYGCQLLYDIDILDEWAGILLRRFPPSNNTGQTMVAFPFMIREPIPEIGKTLLTQPVLIITGGAASIYEVVGDGTDSIDARVSDILKRSTYSDFQTIRGAPLMYCKTHVIEMRNIFMKWIQPVLQADKGTYSEFQPLNLDLCLGRLATLSENKSVGRRDPKNSNSYYLLNDAAINKTSEMLEKFEKNQGTKFSFVGGAAPETWSDASFEDIHPWRFSSRFDNARFTLGGRPRPRTDSMTLCEHIETVTMDWHVNQKNGLVIEDDCIGYVV